MFWIIWLVVRILEVIVGAGVIVNCIRGLLTQEWVYDEESSKMMNASQLVGLLVGAALIAHGSGLWRLVLP